MSRPELKGRWMAGLPVGLALFVASVTQSHGQAAATPTVAPVPAGSTQQSAYRSSIAQETVRKEADKIQIEMAQLVAELKLNGLEGGNLDILSQASTHLSGLSAEEMQKVINALQSASIAGDDSKRNQSLVSAYQGQQDLVTKLKKLSASLTSQQAGDQLINQISGLIERQSANIRQTRTLLPSGHTVAALDENEKTVYGIATAEQTAIAGQIDLMMSNLASATATVPATPDASYKTSKAVYDAMTGTILKDTAHLAAQMTLAGPFPPAMDRQIAVKTYLIALLRVASTNADAVAKLTQAKSQLDQIKADQKDLNDATKNSKIDAKTLADRQAAINDRAEVAKALLAPLNQDASKQVAAAQQSMQQSADALNKAPQQDPAKPNDPAQQQQQDAAKQAAATQQDAAESALADASKELDQQLADVQKQQAASPTEQMAQLQKAQDEIKQAQTDQQVSPQQAAQDAQKAQQDALAQAPDAADQLANATSALQQQAQQNAQQPGQQQQGQQPQAGQQQQGQPPDGQQQAQNDQQQGQTAQQNADAASQALAQAAADIQAQKDALAQAAQAYQALAQASQALDQATQDTKAADQDLQNGQGNNLTDPAKKLADAQSQVAQAGQTPPGQDPSQGGLPQDAKDALAKAADALKNGAIKAVQSDRKGADAQAQQALDAMQEAKGAVDQAMAQVAAQSQQMQGKSDGQGQGQGKGSDKDQMADGNAEMKNGQQNPKGDMGKGLITGQSGAKTTAGSALVMGGLSPKDRDAITQYQAEKSPPEYAPLVQQYLKNLAEASDSH